MTVPSIVAEFREGLERGQLLVQHCATCGRVGMYPRYACPFCQSASLGWRRASGRGILHSFTVLRMGAPEGFEVDLPYAMGVVKLEEGVQLLARLIPQSNGEWNDSRCAEPVRFVPVAPPQSVRRPCAWFERAR